MRGDGSGGGSLEHARHVGRRGQEGARLSHSHSRRNRAHLGEGRRCPPLHRCQAASRGRHRRQKRRRHHPGASSRQRRCRRQTPRCCRRRRCCPHRHPGCRRLHSRQLAGRHRTQRRGASTSSLPVTRRGGELLRTQLPASPALPHLHPCGRRARCWQQRHAGSCCAWSQVPHRLQKSGSPWTTERGRGHQRPACLLPLYLHRRSRRRHPAPRPTARARDGRLARAGDPT
jgi:hypothetical protein